MVAIGETNEKMTLITVYVQKGGLIGYLIP